jgi:ferredoxin
MKFSKWFTPGLSGLAQLLPALILFLKGYKIVGMQPMDLPSNWISIHPGLRKKVVDSIFERCKRITKKFAAKLFSGKKIFRGLLSLPLDLLISPVAAGYYFYGRFALAKTFIADCRCDGCRICEKQCPVHAIQIKSNRPFWTQKCESCMHCMNVCPKHAIQTPHLFVAIMWWLVFSVIPLFIMSHLAEEGSFLDNHFHLFLWIFILITGLPILFFSYQILHFLLRFKLFSRFTSFTSLTKFKFWRRYYAPPDNLTH